MANAPDPITSPPAQDFQPYDACEGGGADDAVQGSDVYAGNGRDWAKIQDGGAADSSGRVSGGWPGNGDSSDGGWRQT